MYSPSLSSFTLDTPTEWQKKVHKNFDSLLLYKYTSVLPQKLWRHYPHCLELHINQKIDLYLENENLYDMFKLTF